MSYPRTPRPAFFAPAHAFQFPRHVASACEEAGHGNVLAEVFPVRAKAGEFDLLVVATGAPIGRLLTLQFEKISKLTSVLLGGKRRRRAAFMFISLTA